jgi:hypothetical protein
MQFKKKEIKEIVNYTPKQVKGQYITEIANAMPIGYYCDVNGNVTNVYVILFTDWRLYKVAVRYGVII